MKAIRVDGFTKRFGDVVATNDLSFEVEQGEVFGFLGPNGAGKSTTINSLLDFMRPTAGHLSVLGMDAETEGPAIRQRIGVLPEGFDTYGRLTGRQHVEFAIESKEADDNPDELLARVGLSDAADRKAGGYSKGMSQRLVLAMALVGEPELLILDEPTTGLDPNGAREMRQIVREENERGATVFFSSHIMEQVEAVCDRVGILRDGEMVAIDTVEGLRDAATDRPVLRVTVDRLDDDALDDVRSVPGAVSVEGREINGNPTIVVEADGSKTTILSAIEEAGLVVEDFSTEEASLEDIFYAYTTEERAEVTA
ncbi:ABC transporter ATP-binding protein [Halovivax gelatinilyticus]|uniref:ABC transporter ATP-binding protein n=1 Tax=Halovivax gelatinilyticus TaxID=2961597 RepID=UPI0020CA6E6F|nr:ABC transporter ATP-binding protein [Halovivax gelatinilyticus]